MATDAVSVVRFADYDFDLGTVELVNHPAMLCPGAPVPEQLSDSKIAA